MKAKTWIPMVALAGLGVVVTRSGTPTRRMIDRTAHTTRKRMRDIQGRTQGMLYRAGDKHPDPDVPDLVLADRIRSQLGVLERQLDLPRIHVSVFDHVAHLHGVVSTHADIITLENAVLAVSGVREVESALHVGLSVSDTRPSTGRLMHDLQQSDATRGLVDVVMQHGIDEYAAIVLVVTVCEDVLHAFRALVPEEAHDVAAVLSADLRAIW